jgi:hypothetical protein
MSTLRDCRDASGANRPSGNTVGCLAPPLHELCLCALAFPGPHLCAQRAPGQRAGFKSQAPWIFVLGFGFILKDQLNPSGSGHAASGSKAGSTGWACSVALTCQQPDSEGAACTDVHQWPRAAPSPTAPPQAAEPNRPGPAARRIGDSGAGGATPAEWGPNRPRIKELHLAPSLPISLYAASRSTLLGSVVAHPADGKVSSPASLQSHISSGNCTGICACTEHLVT